MASTILLRVQQHHVWSKEGEACKFCPHMLLPIEVLPNSMDGFVNHSCSPLSFELKLPGKECGHFKASSLLCTEMRCLDPGRSSGSPREGKDVSSLRTPNSWESCILPPPPTPRATSSQLTSQGLKCLESIQVGLCPWPGGTFDI